ncbi:transporter substrate-binding domain-containing protein [Candidatus Venteria ishoeyi]|uniref:histidine kinase n=3 Tax=Candidatus Venteria ishoeyi TaxID=1899563 RepID=A0A1H6FBM1_9GAMM|nr:transporter substrate-binding domain-containing protein [Candidatus Venteria ishoeyi]SEH07492.1 Virulence sensor protein BvgS precursor [Candidatus Venteria ishoeyi]
MFIRIIFSLLILLLSAALKAQEPPLHKVTMQLQWKHQFEFAGFYAAIAQGFYAQRGLQVELREYQTGMNLTEEVLSGRAQYATTNSSIVRSRLEGKPVKLLANYFKRMPMVILSSPEITKLEDLRGKRLMLSHKDIQSPLLRLVFEHKDLRPEENIEIIPHSFNADPFINGEVDAMSAFITNEPFYLEQQGIDFNVLELADYMRSIGDVYLFTSNAQAEQYPQQTQAFIDASNEGWRYALDHPQEIIDLILSHYSQRKSREALLYEAEKTHDMIMPLPLPIGAAYEPLIDKVAALIMRQDGVGDKSYLRNFLFDTKEQKQLVQMPAIELTTAERAWLKAQPKISMAIATNYPRSYYGKSGKLQGVDVDYIALLEKKLGIQFEHITSNWHTALDRAMKHEVDTILNADKMEYREQYLNFTKVYFAVPQVVIAPENEAAISDLNELCGRKIAVHKGSSYSAFLQQHHPCIELLEVIDKKEILATIITGQAAAGFGAFDNIMGNLQEMALPGLKVIYLKYQQPTGFARIGVRKDQPLLLSILDKGIAAISQEEKSRIASKWLGVEMPTMVDENPNITLSDEEIQFTRQQPVLKIGADNNWKPMDFINEKGEADGFNADLVELLNRKLKPFNFQIQIVSGQWQDIQERAKSGELDGLIGTSSASLRGEYLDFSPKYIETGTVVITRKGLPDIGSLVELATKKLALKRGNSATQQFVHFHQPSRLEYFDTTLEALEAVIIGTQDYTIGSLVEVSYLTKSHLLGNLKIAFSTSEYATGKHVGIRKEIPQALSIINKALAELSSEEFNRLKTKWINFKPKPSLQLTDNEKAWIEAHPTIRLASDANMPPYESITNEKYQGVAADYIRLIGQRLGIEFQRSPVKPWPEIIQMVKQRKLDMLSFAMKTEQRKGYAHFTKPYISHPMMIITSDKVGFVDGLDGLKGKILAVEKGYASAELLSDQYPSIAVQTYSNSVSAMLAVSKGEAFAYIGDIAIMSYIARHHGITNLKVSGELQHRFEMGFGVRSDWPELVPILQKALDSISEEEKNSILQKWFSMEVTPQIDYTLLRYVLGMALLILGLMLHWNQKLRHEILARKQAQHSHHESEEKYRLLFEHSDDPMWLIRDSLFVLANAAAARILGCKSVDELSNLHPATLSPPFQATGQASEQLADQMMQLAYRQGHHHFEWLHQKRNGTVFPVEVSLTRIPYEGQSALFCIWRDISERKQSEQALQQSKAQYDELVQRVPVGLFTIRSMAKGEGKVDYISPRATQMLGIRLTDAWQTLSVVVSNIHPDDRADFFAKNTANIAAKTDFFWEGRFIVTGKTRWCRIESNATLQEDETCVWQGVITDITAQKEMRQNLHMLNLAVTQIAEGIAIADMDGNNQFVNKAWADMHGYTQEELSGTHLSLFHSKEQIEKEVQPFFEQLMQTGHLEGEDTHIKKDGTIFNTWMSVNVVKDDRENPVAFVGACRDITERIKAQQVLQKAKEEAEAANRAKSIFLANMSHELRTPLNAIMGFAQILAQSPRLADSDKQQANSIYRGGEYLLTLINDILDLAKVEAGRIELFPTAINIQLFVQELADMFRLRARKKNISFKYHTDTSLPAGIHADATRLRQVLVNLLGNAVKFTEQGHVCLQISYDNEVLHIHVEDTGIGIAPEQHEEIFQPFSQTSENRYKAQGTGLGLSITRKIVELMGGTLSLESHLGQGSCFYVQVPVKAVLKSFSSPQKTLSQNTIINYHRRQGEAPLRILITDDVADNREVVCKILRSLNFDTQEADNGENCLQLIPTYHPHLVLMDLRMPGLDGLETTRRLHELPGFEKLPVIVISAGAYGKDEKNSRAAGCVDYLAKPIERTLLLQTLQKYLPLQWIYAEQQATSTASADPAIKVNLSTEWLEALEQAVVEANLKQANSLLEKIKAEDTGLVAQLTEWLETYEYQQLLDWIETHKQV